VSQIRVRFEFGVSLLTTKDLRTNLEAFEVPTSQLNGDDVLMLCGADDGETASAGRIFFESQQRFQHASVSLS